MNYESLQKRELEDCDWQCDDRAQVGHSIADWNKN